MPDRPDERARLSEWIEPPAPPRGVSGWWIVLGLAGWAAMIWWGWR